MVDVVRRREVVPVEDGTRLELEVFEQVEGREAPVLLCLPAMGVPARYYEPFALELHRRGFHVVTSDLRGHGASSVRVGRGTDFGYYEMVARDLGAVVRAVRAAFQDSPLFLVGHSLGGQLGSLYLGLEGEGVRGLVLVAASSVYYRNYGALGGVKVLLGTQLAAVIATVWGYFPGRRLRFADNESARVIQDWARQARTGRYVLSGAAQDFEALLARVERPVLAISVDGDSLAPPAAVDHLYGKMPRARVVRWHFTQSDAGGAHLDHFRWVRHGAPVAARIAGWVGEVLAGEAGAGQDPRTEGRP
ncbi:alpha/beta fold hydrolase [Archangium violaceum]|uniref:alpha/beta hydrolase family protein n=1 Tax=Archangium violaceum TaxID=83451 RepID=UPI0019522E78|nr:alpha/beta fold hydrolase [Archangium violaceum]QRN94335.1 alpha/beta fold hydrolase [Archangium violaceum]